MASNADPAAEPAAARPSSSIPVTMLSGFLGAGKTTVLRHLLQDSSHLKIGCVVNDVADVNIDAKLVRNDRSRQRNGGGGGNGGGEFANGEKGNKNNTTSDLADTIELANGCACCSIQDELFGSFEQLLNLADAKGATYDRIVLENSGVAEPQNIRDKFSEAVANGHPLATRLHLDTMVTVVDAASFVADFASRAPLAARPDLGEGGNLRPVVDLLVEQVECADFVILNKIDQLVRNTKKKEEEEESKRGEEEGDKGAAAVEEAAGAAGAAGATAPASEEDALASLRAIVASLNPLAKISACERGRVDIEAVFGREATGLVAKLNVEGQHRGAVAHATALAEAEKKKGEDGEGEEGGGEGGGCAVCAATGEDKKERTSCGHGHGDHHHHHHQGDGKEKKEPSHHSHTNSHSHHEHSAECAAKGCTEDHSHDHEHDHEHHHHHEHAAPKPKKLRQETTAAARFGIRSFVYRRRRPFHPGRLRDTVLRWLPVATNAATDSEEKRGGKDAADADAADAAAKEAEAKNPSPIRAVLRSKGFMWMSHSHATAFYWSHAGQHFEIRDEGDWWAAVPADEWPEDQAQRAVILADFQPGPEPGHRSSSPPSSSSSDDAVVARALASRYGDRRQEIVFIGAGMDEGRICEALDGALLTEAELARYDQNFGVPPPPSPPSDTAAAAAAVVDGDAAAKK